MLSAAATGTTIALVSADDFFNSGNYTLTTAGTGRWLIYSQQPTDNNLGGLSGSFNRYSCAFNTVGTCAANATLGTTVAIPGSGNGLIYSYTPTVTATASSISALTYGDAAPNLTGYAYTVSGYLTGEGADTVTGTLTGTTAYAPGSNIGTYDITYSAGTLSSALGYQINYASNATAFIVNPKTLTFAVTGINKIYDGSTAGSVSFADNRFGSDDLSYSYSASYLDKNVGNGKTINVSGISLGGTKAGNYTLASTTSTTSANITPKGLTIRALDSQRKVGEPNPAFNVSYDGFVAGDSSAAVSGLNITTNATNGSPTGTYQITPYGAYAQNYSIAYVDGEFKILPSVQSLLPSTVESVAQDPWLTQQVQTQFTNNPVTNTSANYSNNREPFAQIINAEQGREINRPTMLQVDPALVQNLDIESSIFF